jgi:hypothetical protein
LPAPKALTTVDLFAEAAVETSLGRRGLCEAVFRSLQTARMRVPAERQLWVVDLIGDVRASKCPSLPKSARGG